VNICDAIGNPWGFHVSKNNLVEISFSRGEITQTISEAEDLLAGGREIGFPLFVGLPLMLLARAQLELNQLDRALDLAEQSASALVVMKSIWINYANGFLGRVLVRRGEMARARQILEPLWHIDEGTAAQFYGFITVAPAIAELALADHRLAEGLSYCSWFVEHCEREGLSGFGAEMYHLRAQIQFERGDLSSAKVDLDRARTILERAENSLLLWRVYATLAQINARAATESANQAADRENIVAEIAGLISDAKQRDGFLSREDVKKIKNA
jgi:multidrug efflux pump subunit AcrA (membrane-fusion protein)